MAAKGKLKRAAETAVAPGNRQEAEAMLARLGEIRRDMALHSAALEEGVAALKAAAETAAQPLAAEAEALFRGLQLYAEANRAALTEDGKTKTVWFATGLLAWRTRPPSVKLRDVAAVIETLRATGLDRFLRVKHEVNKEALLADPVAAQSIPGVTIGSAGEEFIAEPLVVVVELVAGAAR